MAIPQRKEADDIHREYDQGESWCESDDNEAVARRSRLMLRRRSTGWGWLWLIVIALFIWWAIWGMGNSGGWWRGHHRTIGPGRNNGAITGGANHGPNNGNPPADHGANAPSGGPTGGNGNPSPPQR